MTTSLEISKALKELGYPQGDGVFYWYYGKDYTKNNVRRILWNAGDNKFVDHRREKVACPLPSDAVIAAPTAEEILEKLPPSIIVNGETLHLVIMDDRDWVGEASWDICYSKDRLFSWDIHVREKGKIGDGAFAGACAKMWILLKKLNLL